MTAHLHALYCTELEQFVEHYDKNSDKNAEKITVLRNIEHFLYDAISVTHGKESQLFKMFEQFKASAHEQLKNAYHIEL